MIALTLVTHRLNYRGTRASSLAGEAVSWRVLAQLRNGAGRVAILRWEEIHNLKEAVSKGISGAVLILPDEEHSVTQDKDSALLESMALEHELFQVSFSRK